MQMMVSQSVVMADLLVKDITLKGLEVAGIFTRTSTLRFYSNVTGDLPHTLAAIALISNE